MQSSFHDTNTVPDTLLFVFVYTANTVSKLDPASDTKYDPLTLGLQLYHTECAVLTNGVVSPASWVAPTVVPDTDDAVTML